MRLKEGITEFVRRKILLAVLSLVIGLIGVGCAEEPLEICADGVKVTEITLYEGQRLQLTASQGQDTQVWSMDHEEIANVEPDGVLTAKQAGVATVTLTAGWNTAQAVIQVLPGRTVWIIGDSIFDYRDNSDTDMVQTIFYTAGYSELYMDNVAGSTIRSARDMGILDHIASGLYEQWEKPDLIVIFRGTNDCYFALQQPNIFAGEEDLDQAVEQTCAYFRQLQPQAKIVWITPLWRFDLPQSDLDEVRQTLHEICPRYDVEVFDIHLQGTFAELNYDNHWMLLYDGIHLHDIGASDMTEILGEYLAEMDE